jgi:hypothetical protein
MPRQRMDQIVPAVFARLKAALPNFANIDALDDW